MLTSVQNFYRRHRRKILIYAGVAGGAYAAGKYLRYKFDEWQHEQIDEAQNAARKNFHFENHQKNCTATFLSFLPNVRNVIMEKLNTEQLLDILKLKPANKLEIWDQMKVLSLTRLLCSVISNVILVIMLKVKMNVIGAYTFATMQPDDTSSVTAEDENSMSKPVLPTADATANNNELSELQLRYLDHIRYFVEEKLPLLIDDCLDVVERCVSAISLKDKLSHDKLKAICKDVMSQLKAKHTSLKNDKHEFCAYIINPTWSEMEDSNDIYSRMVTETINILEGIDCSLVLDTLLSIGLEQVLDSFEDQFVTFRAAAKSADSITSLEECIKEDFRQDVLPVPKIIPILNSQIHEIFKAGPNQFFDALFSQELIRQLSKNVYELTCKEYM